MVLKELPAKGIEAKFYELCLPVVRECDLDIYDLDYNTGAHRLRVFITRKEDISADLEDCVKVDRALGPYFESEQWIPDEIVLEVSSPGLYRHLNRPEHFEAAIDQNICLTLTRKWEELVDPQLLKGKKISRFIKSAKTAIAKLIAVEEKGLEVELDKLGKIKIDYQEIKKANIEADINF